MCGGNYAISLYRLPDVTLDMGAGGRFDIMMEAPVTASHVMQVRGVGGVGGCIV
jgi:hypothetical protein